MEYDINKDLLPLGSVIQVRFNSDKFIIIGFYPKNTKDGKTYDYALVRYPEGLVDLDDSIVANRDLVKRVIHMGYISEAEKKFKEDLQKEANKIDILDFPSN